MPSKKPLCLYSFASSLRLGVKSMQSVIQKFGAMQQKMVEAGAIASLLLCLSPGLAATQASAAKCLHKLSKDEEYHALIIKAGALHALLQLLAADDTEPTPRAAATEAVGGIITSDKMAAETIPYLVSMMAAESLKVSFPVF